MRILLFRIRAQQAENRSLGGMPQAPGWLAHRPATSVHGFVLAVFRARARSIMRLYHSILFNALLRREFSNGWDNGDKEHDPQVGERRFVGRKARRVDAMHAKRSITSTVRAFGARDCSFRF